MVTRCIFLITATAIATFDANGRAAAQPQLADSLVAQNFEQINAVLSQLKGQNAWQDKSVNFLLQEVAKQRKVMEKLGPLSDYVKAVADEKDQQQQFIEALLRLVCAIEQNGCETRRRMDEIEAEQRRLLGILQVPELEPTPEPPEIILDQDSDAPILEPTPAEPDRELPPIEQWHSPRYVPVPPRYPPQWDGSLDYVTDQPGSFCPHAVIVARGINYPFADGTAYFGDVYRTCGGNFVLLRRPLYQRYSYRGY